MRTQWQVGMSGATGLFYPSMFALMDRLGLDAEAWDELFDDLRVMEAEALKVMRE